MEIFSYIGPLKSTSKFFRGRNNELDILDKASKGIIDSNVIIQGGRQTGKTSLLFKFKENRKDICYIDFQIISSAHTATVFSFIGNCIADHLMLKNPIDIKDGIGLLDFLRKSLNENKTNFLGLFFEELGALQIESRIDIANFIRGLFTNRIEYFPNSKVFVVLAGGIELYDLHHTKGSPLHNVCTPIYLPDIEKKEAVQLIIDGLSYFDIPLKDSIELGEAIYDLVEGHPYLTQRCGSLLVDKLTAVILTNKSYIKEIKRLLFNDDPLLRSLHNTLKNYDLLETCSNIITSQEKFSRSYENIAKLELIGILKNRNGFCIARNTLFRQALENWTETKTKYNLFICYSHKDKRWLEKLNAMLMPMVRKNLKVWDDTKIKPGFPWRQKIIEAIENAKVAVLLVSPDFLASNFILNNELPIIFSEAQNDNLKILILHVSYSLYYKTELEKYQSLNDPKKPIDSLTQAFRNKELVSICEKINEAVNS